jgi:hypothetical protein
LTTVPSSTKLLSSKSVKSFLTRDVTILSLSAPGAPKLLNPAELSVSKGSISEFTTVSSISNPIL